MLRTTYDLPAWVLSTCLRWQGLGEGHPTFAEVAAWHGDDTAGARDAAAREALATMDLFSGDLLSGGLSSGTGMAPDFQNALLVLASPTVELSFWANDQEGPYQVLVASAGADAVQLTRIAEQVRLRPVHPESLAEELLAALPEATPARAQAINARVSAYQNLLTPDTEGALASSGGPEAQRLQTVLQLPRLHAAELHVAARDRAGERRRAGPLILLDTEQGRWLIARKSTGAAGEEWISAAPGGDRRIRASVAELLTSVR
ncbi:ESAT-6 protein secretion system EspG family protein [Tamaricihabitans halophyticus]|uniref:ESAT-6 protein secretion system EspG family protein n=1 Tax=Tamaricihabitans halophyticus TaxID=1262583 RepID=A0A4R2QYF6_9PSEU|nr:ESX secretion-associated protein EspG [Tamaricihabitans halophyticus]TCP54068.1 ESAT-6 protein secretion system EspG family protein [Tamaricihabitans halophyticus]